MGWCRAEFVAGVLAVLALGIIPVWRISSVRRFMERFDAPDRALGLFALFLALVLLVQQTTNFQHGIVYIWSTRTVRIEINTHSLSSPYANKEWLVAVAYWLFAAFALLAGVSFIRGIYRDIKHPGRRLGDVETTLHNDLTRIEKLLDQRLRDGDKPDDKRSN